MAVDVASIVAGANLLTQSIGGAFTGGPDGGEQRKRAEYDAVNRQLWDPLFLPEHLKFDDIDIAREMGMDTGKYKYWRDKGGFDITQAEGYEDAKSRLDARVDAYRNNPLVTDARNRLDVRKNMYSALDEGFRGEGMFSRPDVNYQAPANFSPYAPVKLARGGIVTRPTNAIIGENGPEAVIPLKDDSMVSPDLPSYTGDGGFVETPGADVSRSVGMYTGNPNPPPLPPQEENVVPLPGGVAPDPYGVQGMFTGGTPVINDNMKIRANEALMQPHDFSDYREGIGEYITGTTAEAYGNRFGGSAWQDRLQRNLMLAELGILDASNRDRSRRLSDAQMVSQGQFNQDAARYNINQGANQQYFNQAATIDQINADRFFRSQADRRAEEEAQFRYNTAPYIYGSNF